MADELSELRELARGIVLAQGNVYIKELLRERDIPIGETKADFERHLLGAIKAGGLRLADLEGWLRDVEGWGDQHIYLFNVSPELAGQPLFRSVAEARRAIEAAGLGDLWEASDSLAFPDEPSLSRVAFDGEVLTMAWHEGSPSWTAVPSLDVRVEQGREVALAWREGEPVWRGDAVTREEDGDWPPRAEGVAGDRDWYELRARRRRARRAVTRFELRLPLGLAGIFVPVRVSAPEHERAVAEVQEQAGRLFPRALLDDHRVPISEVIKNLDQAQIDPQARRRGVTSHSTRLTSGGAYVEFAALSAGGDYLASPAVREVRDTIKRGGLARFTGSDGKLELLRDAYPALSRSVKLRLYGEERRIRIWKRLKADDVWLVLATLASHQ